MFTFLAGFAVLGYLRRPHMQAPFVLVELRAIEETGHPVTAAKVSINNKSMGVTDSFGEWRRYLRLHPGEQLSVELLKAGEPSYRGARLLKVPKNRSGDHDYEVKASIEMMTPKALSKRKEQTQQQRKKVVDETDPETPARSTIHRLPVI
jgi:hypothetical protein